MKKIKNINEIERYANNIAKETAKAISYELTEEANNTMLKFYSYEPQYYFRHENFIRKYKPQRFYHNSTNKFSGGVKLFTNSVPNVYQDKPATVANFVYNGLHGWASIGWHGSAPIMKPSPINKIKAKQKNIIENIQKYINDAQNKINS